MHVPPSVAAGGNFTDGAEEKLQQCGGAVKIVSTEMAFAVVCKNGLVVPWGKSFGI